MPNVSRSDLYWAIAVALLTGTLFLVTLRPDVGGTEDSPKFQFLGQVLGTAHTPGYPFYTIATWAFTRVPVGTLAWRVNLFSAVCGVFSCVIIFLMSRRLRVSRALAFVAALAAATGFPVWSNAITAEVYTLSALMSAWTIYLLIAWAQTGALWRLFAACIVFAAGLGNHLTIVGLLPAALAYGIWKDRGVLKPRVIVPAAVIGFFGVAQYGFIALRTIQGAPYLEARADTLRGVYDVIIARDVSWARFYQAADKVVGIEVPMLLEGLRVHMGTITVALVVIAIGIAAWSAFGLRGRARGDASADPADVLLIAGGAAGTLGMIANLWGDVVGFITPVIVLLWPLAAYALEFLVRRVWPRDSAVNAVAMAALLLPIWNIYSIYPAIEPLRRPGDGPALRAMYSRLPANSAVVAHNYFIARIFNYLDFSNEYDPDPSPKFLSSDVNQVKAAWAEGRQVFALEEAVPWLASQGFRFDATALSTQPFGSWLATQQAGTTVLIAAAGRVLPIDWLPNTSTHLSLSGLGSGSFGAMAWTTGADDGRVEQSNTTVSIVLERRGRPVTVSADDSGPRITWGDDVLAAIDRGMIAILISPTGRIAGRWQFTVDEEAGAKAPPIAYVLRADAPCTVLRPGQPVDITAIAAEGALLATIEGRPIPAEISIAAAGSPADWRLRLANGRGKTSIDTARGRLMLDGAPGTRAVFEWLLPPNQSGATATLDSNDHAVRVCQTPIPPFAATGAIDIGPAADAHFGTGWHFAEDAGTQHFRWSRRQSTIQWQMPGPAPARFILPLRAAHADGAMIRATLNGTEIGTCTLPKGAWAECRLTATAAQSKAGINTLVLTSDTVAPSDRPGDSRELAFVMQTGRVRFGS